MKMKIVRRLAYMGLLSMAVGCSDNGEDAVEVSESEDDDSDEDEEESGESDDAESDDDSDDDDTESEDDEAEDDDSDDDDTESDDDEAADDDTESEDDEAEDDEAEDDEAESDDDTAETGDSPIDVAAACIAEDEDNECPDLIACVVEECSDDFNECFETGGACEDVLTCVEAADFSCDADCEASEACDECITDSVGACAFTSCGSELLACNTGSTDDPTPDEEEEAGSDSACAQLEACCDSLSGDEQATCNQAVDAATGPTAEIACGLALGLFSSLCG